MDNWTDQQLLRQFADGRSEPAFGELVRRHIDLVYSAALRMTGDPQSAQDVAQNVFLALAQGAQQLTNHPVLSGWLHRTARNLSGKLVRSDIRRRAGEQEAAAMNELLAGESEAVWEQIAPHLDAALNDLGEPDRDVLFLRYFERKSARDMAQVLGTSEETAQKRVNRALERLRQCFSKRGVTTGTGGLVVLITANAVQAAPAGLAITVTTAAAFAQTTVTTAAAAATTKAITMTTLQKTLVTATVAVLAGAGIYEAHQAAQLRDQVQTLLQQQTPLAKQVDQLQRERSEAASRAAGLQAENARNLNPNQTELLKLRGEVTRLRNDAQELARLKSADAGSDNDPVKASSQAWLKRVTRLKGLFDELPYAKIPELQFLSAEDWLRHAEKADLDTDEQIRTQLSSLREEAKGKFASKISQALRDYAKANQGQSPTDISQLKPYFKDSVDEAVFQRYQLVHAGNLGNVPQGSPLLAEKSPVDDLYDTIWQIGAYKYSVKSIGEYHAGSSGGSFAIDK